MSRRSRPRRARPGVRGAGSAPRSRGRTGSRWRPSRRGRPTRSTGRTSAGPSRFSDDPARRGTPRRSGPASNPRPRAPARGSAWRGIRGRGRGRSISGSSAGRSGPGWSMRDALRRPSPSIFRAHLRGRGGFGIGLAPSGRGFLAAPSIIIGDSMRITILTYLEREGADEHDVVVDQVASALKANGHSPSVLGVHGDVSKLVAGIKRRKPDLVFNLLEMFGTDIRGDVAVAGLLDLLGVKYTGGGPAELSLRQDKALAKKSWRSRRSPRRISPSSRPTTWRPAGTCGCPCSSSRCATDASIGILAGEIPGPRRDLDDEAGGVDPREAPRLGPGRGIRRGARVLRRDPGECPAEAFPPIEMDFSGMPDGRPAGPRLEGQMVQVERRVQGVEIGPGRHPRRTPGPACKRPRSTPTAPSTSGTTAGSTSGSPRPARFM